MSLLRFALSLLFKTMRRWRHGAPSLESMKFLCLELIDDIRPDRRHSLTRSILHARHRADMWDLRSALFGLVSLSFGEREARARLARLDELMS